MKLNRIVPDCAQIRPEDLVLLRRGKGKKLLRISQRDEKKEKKREKTRPDQTRREKKDLKKSGSAGYHYIVHNIYGVMYTYNKRIRYKKKRYRHYVKVS